MTSFFPIFPDGPSPSFLREDRFPSRGGLESRVTGARGKGVPLSPLCSLCFRKLGRVGEVSLAPKLDSVIRVRALRWRPKSLGMRKTEHYLFLLSRERCFLSPRRKRWSSKGSCGLACNMLKISTSLTSGRDDFGNSVHLRTCSSRNVPRRLSVFCPLGLKQEEKETASKETGKTLRCSSITVQLLGVLFGR